MIYDHKKEIFIIMIITYVDHIKITKIMKITIKIMNKLSQ